MAFSQGLGLPLDDVLYGYGFNNLVMLLSAVPTFGSDDSGSDTRSKGEKEWDDAFDANNPDLAGRFE